MVGRTECRAIENDNWGIKEYKEENNSGTIKDINKIRFNMWELKANYYGRKGFDNKCPMCHSEEDTTEYDLECDKGDKIYFES